MCHADVGMYRIEWLPEPDATGEVQELRSNAQDVCVDWDRFYAWAEGRALLGDRYVQAPAWDVKS